MDIMCFLHSNVATPQNLEQMIHMSEQVKNQKSLTSSHGTYMEQEGYDPHSWSPQIEERFPLNPQ